MKGVSLKITTRWRVMSCSLVEQNKHLWGGKGKGQSRPVMYHEGTEGR